MAKPPKSADGTLTPSWSSTRVPRSARNWRAGWDMIEDSCPPDPGSNPRPGRQVRWREAGGTGGERWRALHEKRRRVVRGLRKAGYVSRNRWARVDNGTRTHGIHEVPSMLYLDGPAVGREAVDPWKLARKVDRCCALFLASLRLRVEAGTLTAVPIPHACGSSHVCPVCGATGASARARAVRAVLLEKHAAEPADVVLATFTQKVSRGEPLWEALGRLRGAWQRMTRGRPGKRWREVVEGFFYGDEAPRSWPGKRTKGGTPRPSAESAEHWHAHRHCVVRLRPGVPLALAREVIGELWRSASGAEAGERDMDGYGWEPYAGGCGVDSDGDVTDWSGDWFELIDMDRPKEVYQACKYPSPSSDLRPVALAEFVAVAHMRRWHHGGGSLRGVMKAAALLEADGWSADDVEESWEAPPPLDLGVNIACLAPGNAPDVAAIAPDIGVAGADPVDAPIGTVSWELVKGMRTPAVYAAVSRAGGECYREDVDLERGTWTMRVALLADWVALECRTNTDELRRRRLIMDERSSARACKERE